MNMKRMAIAFFVALTIGAAMTRAYAEDEVPMMKVRYYFFNYSKTDPLAAYLTVTPPGSYRSGTVTPLGSFSGEWMVPKSSYYVLGGKGFYTIPGAGFGCQRIINIPPTAQTLTTHILFYSSFNGFPERCTIVAFTN